MAAAPATKYNEIVLKLGVLDISSANSSNIDVLKAKKLANELVQKDPYHAYILYGVISCIEDDATSMRRNHQNAIRLSGGNADSNYQYVVSLIKHRLFSEALEYAETAANKDRTNTMCLDTLIYLVHHLKFQDKFREYTDRWLKLEKDYHPLHLAEMTDDEYLDVVYSDPEHVEALEYLANN